MGWFDEQIKQRKQRDSEAFADSFMDIAGAVTGGRSVFLGGDGAKNAVGEILQSFGIRPSEVPDNITDPADQLEYMLRPHGIMHRRVKLTEGWYKRASGAMLAKRRSDGSTAALIPSGFSGYTFIDGSGRRVKVNRKNVGELSDEAMVFYRPFPLEKVSIRGFLRFMAGTVSRADVLMINLAMLLAALVGMLVPKINSIILGSVINSGDMRLLWAISAFLICVTISSAALNAIHTLLLTRISTKMDLTVGSASMMRLLSLPADFFREYSAGELSQRMEYIGTLCTLLIDTVLSSALTAVYSLIYVIQIFSYAPALTVPALAVIAATMIFSVISVQIQTKVNRQKTEVASRESGMTFALISGIQKIKLSGSEKRAFARWGRLYAETARLEYDPPLIIKVNQAVVTAIALAGTAVMYYTAVRSGIGAADYYAFTAAYGVVSSAFAMLSMSALSAAQIKPILEAVKPIFEAKPEIDENKEVVTRISGAVELSNVSFSYGEGMPPVLDDLSLKIRAGQYVAIVGRTGCGKSTLVRLLLGFEKPQKGSVYYDGKDIGKLDLKSLRRKIGIVMQDGKLFQGDIFSNITISAPQLTLDDAWEAAELAGVAEDIRRMPMGMHTIVSEGGGGISGGQRQRLVIARAIAPRPKLMILDEATSALDNITQHKVSESLSGLGCTRIVIAHRLSTIRSCDRIIVLDGGWIIEDGSYEELIEKNGFFAELVARQRIDSV